MAVVLVSGKRRTGGRIARRRRRTHYDADNSYPSYPDNDSNDTGYELITMIMVMMLMLTVVLSMTTAIAVLLRYYSYANGNGDMEDSQPAAAEMKGCLLEDRNKFRVLF